MKDGQFQLAEDESSVSTAEQQLSDYKDEMDYEQQLQELQDGVKIAASVPFL